jgi:hypothetical protein
VRHLRTSLFVVLAMAGSAERAQADWLLTPFAGASFRTATSFFDLDDVTTHHRPTYGVSLSIFPDGIFGGEIEVSSMPSVFTGHDLVESSSVLTATGSLLIAVPKQIWSRVRPYAVIGAGMVHVASTDVAGIFPIDSTRPAASAGAGVWIPITPRFGMRGEARFLRSGSEGGSTWFECWRTTAGATIAF